MFATIAVALGALGAFLYRIGVVAPAVFLGLIALGGVVLAFSARPRSEVIIARPSGLELRLRELRRWVEWSEVREVQPQAMVVTDLRGRPLFTRYSAQVTLSDGAHFVIDQAWDGHRQVLGCMALRCFDPIACFDLPTQSVAATRPEGHRVSGPSVRGPSSSG